jgi:hypothetical protein
VLKIEVLHIIRVKCVCHSVQLASYAVTDYWTLSSAKPTTGFYSFQHIFRPASTGEESLSISHVLIQDGFP